MPAAPANPRATSVRSIELAVPDLDAARRFYEDAWGLTEVARGRNVSYLRGTGSEHHIVALHGGGEPGAVRVNLGVPSRAAVDALYERLTGAGITVIAAPGALDAVMRGAGRLKGKGFRVQWGLGRHGPGANVFAYFVDPNGLAIEYTCEMEQVDDTYRGKTPDEWAQRENPDAWGVADPPTDLFECATGAPVRT